MTCRDIIISKMKELGADGLMNTDEGTICHCTPDDWTYLCDIDCIPAKLINGQWEAVEEVADKDCYTGDFTIEGNEFKHIIVSGKFEPMYKEYCEYTYKDYEYSSGKCRADTSCGIFWYGEIDLLHNFKHCPECSKEIKEVNND